MKKLFKTVLFLTAVLTTTNANARVWRVNPNPNSGAEYQGFSALMENYEFEEGDTIICDPGEYGNQTITRKNIKVFGPGYLLNQNTDFNETSSAKFESIYVKASDVFIGGIEARNIISDENTIIDKCKASNITCVSHNECQVTRCLILSHIDCPSTGLVSNNIIYNLDYATNLHLISAWCTNCIIRNNTVVFGNNASYNWVIESNRNCSIYDNIFIRIATTTDSEGRPLSATGIIDFENASENNCLFYNNVLSGPEKFKSDLYPNNHYVNATVENTFVWEGSEDGKFRLKEGSPAKGASSNGGDCGAFGGALPYVLSGIPAFMPRITNASIPDSPTDGKISVTLTIKTQNE